MNHYHSGDPFWNLLLLQDNIKQALDKLCSYLPSTLVDECDDFVNTYSNQLVDMLIADMNPQEVCVYLKLCTDKEPPKVVPIAGPEVTYGGEIGKFCENCVCRKVDFLEYHRDCNWDRLCCIEVSNWWTVIDTYSKLIKRSIGLAEILKKFELPKIMKIVL